MRLQIEKMVYGGEGLARLEPDERGRRKAVFVPFVLEGEQVEAEISRGKTEFSRGRLKEVLTPSTFRIEPKCPYFAGCGGCHYQHAAYEHQLAIKTTILTETLARIGKIQLGEEVQVHPSPAWNYRNRTRMRVQTQPEFAIGYSRFASHVLLPVKECPISSPLINRTIDAVWQLGRQGSVPGEVREIEFFANHDDSALHVLLLTAPEFSTARGQAFGNELKQALPQLSGVSYAPERGQNQPEQAINPETGFGSGEVRCRAGNFDYRVSAGAFFQTNRHMTEALVKLVVDGEQGDKAIELYAGVGLFTVPLAKNFENVTAVESSAISHSDLQQNAPVNAKAVRATSENFLRDRSKKATADLIVVDPPRAGLAEKVARSIAELDVARMTYVSCDPATLARDLRILRSGGFRIESVHLVDLFPQTFHVESVTKLVR